MYPEARDAGGLVARVRQGGEGAWFVDTAFLCCPFGVLAETDALKFLLRHLPGSSRVCNYGCEDDGEGDSTG